MDKLPDANTSLMMTTSDDVLPWPEVLGVVVLRFYYWTLNQFIV